MTLLDDLQAIDLTTIVDAKASISVSVGGEGIAGLVADGAGLRVLGDLGDALALVQAAVADPTALLEPLTGALTGLLVELGVDPGVAGYVEAVGEAAGIVARVLGGFSGDPGDLRLGGLGVGEVLGAVGGGLGDHAAVVTGEVQRLRVLIESVEGGLPADPAALLGPALQILLPVPAGPLTAVRGWAGQLTAGIDRVSVDARLTQGLVAALVRVRVAAEADDVAGVREALAALEDLRAHTVTQLAAGLRAAAGAVSALGVERGTATLREARRALAGADVGVIGQLEEWRAMIAAVRATVGRIDPDALMDFFEGALDQIEAVARDVLLDAVERSVDAVEAWLGDLLAQVPLRPLRLRLSDAIAGVARALREADLDGPAEAMRAALAGLGDTLQGVDPAALVQQGVDRLEAAVRGLVDDLLAAFGAITAAIEAVAGQAADVLGRAVEGIAAFGDAVASITAAVEDLGIEDVAAEVAALIGEVRADVTALLQEAPLPEPLRAGVEQLTALVRSIDVEEIVGRPLRELAAELTIPDAVAATVRDGLTAVADMAAALVPANLADELEKVLRAAFAAIGDLDTSAVTGAVTGAIGSAQRALAEVSITELAAPAGAVFQEVLRAVDRIHPRVLLAPAIELYDRAMGAVALPSPDAIATRAGTVVSQAGEAAARAATAPAADLAGSGASGGGAGAAAGAGPPREEPPADLRPGDIVRLVGFLPARLREALAALGAGPAGEVLAAIDDQLGATATALRAARDGVLTLGAAADAALAAALTPLAAAQVDAQLALRGSVAISADGVEAEASLDLLARCGPAALQVDLDGERQEVALRAAGAGAALAGELAEDLDAVADLLDALLPAGLLADLDALLAALDPEPIAAELDALLADVLAAMPAFIAAAAPRMQAMEARIRALIRTYNPGALMQRYLRVLDVIRRELAVLDPGRLADELAEVHAEVRAALAAYDPLMLARELDALIAGVADLLGELDPAALMPDLTGLGAEVARIAEVVPATALAGVGQELEEVALELRAIDVEGLIAALDDVPERVADGITTLVEALKAEIIALLEAIEFASGGASASVSVDVAVEL